MPSRPYLLLFALLLFGWHEVQMSSSARLVGRDAASEALLQALEAGAPCAPCGLSTRRADLPAIAGTTLPHPDTAFTSAVAEVREASATGSFLARHYVPLR